MKINNRINKLLSSTVAAIGLVALCNQVSGQILFSAGTYSQNFDTLASTGIAIGYGYLITTPFKKRYNISTALEPAPGGAVVRLSYDY
jgi:hypothetical protein